MELVRCEWVLNIETYYIKLGAFYVFCEHRYTQWNLNANSLKPKNGKDFSIKLYTVGTYLLKPMENIKKMYTIVRPNWI